MAEISQTSAALSDEARLDRRQQIGALQAHMEALPDEEKLSIEAMTFHYFASGCYVREMRIPAGVLVVGKIHKLDHIAILMQGRVTITSEKGSETHTAPKIMVAPPGTKRVAFAHTDTIWASVHPAGDETDPEKLEERLIAKNFEELEQVAAQPAAPELPGSS